MVSVGQTTHHLTVESPGEDGRHGIANLFPDLASAESIGQGKGLQAGEFAVGEAALAGGMVVELASSTGDGAGLLIGVEGHPGSA